MAACIKPSFLSPFNAVNAPSTSYSYRSVIILPYATETETSFLSWIIQPSHARAGDMFRETKKNSYTSHRCYTQYHGNVTCVISQIMMYINDPMSLCFRSFVALVSPSRHNMSVYHRIEFDQLSESPLAQCVGNDFSLFCYRLFI